MIVDYLQFLTDDLNFYFYSIYRLWRWLWGGWL